MYQALYRKYRPKTFDDVTGQDPITFTLKAQLRGGKLSHAYLFAGTRGTGKTSCAKILAKAVNCENPVDGEPCNECHICKGIDSGAILDVTEMDAASNRRIEDIRALLEESYYLPAQTKKRVYIVDEVHMLTRESFHAILKTLEEPPEHLLFILATTDPHKIPSTILSRCQRFSFHRIPKELIAERLMEIAEKEGINLKPDAAAFIARLADGAMRDALSLLERCQGEPDIDRVAARRILGYAAGEEIADIYRLATNDDIIGAIAKLDELYSAGTDVASVLEMLGDYVRDSMIVSVAPDTGTELLSGMFSNTELQRGDVSMLLGLGQKIQTALKDIDNAPNRKTAAELAIISLGTEIAVPSSVKFSLPQTQPSAAQRPPQPSAPSTPSAQRPPQSYAQVPPTPAAPQTPPPFTAEQFIKELNLVPALTRELKSGRDVTTEITSDAVILYAAHPFIEGQLTLPTTISEFKNAAQKLSGREFKIVILNGSAPKSYEAPPVYEPPPDALENKRQAEESPLDALDDLAARFGGIISFEEE
ncbi:MAG: DNA polymerase III subunit gamma/tau [Oscillospiraceae bacterium]|jgi:DNA polymerase-3 subunit gamma/tau|nr:DNA polymerase III subunit gamma/tau [Oscillospiraceae bacterium]